MLSQLPLGQYTSQSAIKPLYKVTIKNEEGFDVITDSQTNSPADDEGLKIGDHITKIDNEKMETAQDVVSYIQTKKPQDEIVLKIKRRNKTIKLNIQLSSLPSPVISFPFDPGTLNFNFQPMDIDSLFESPKAFLGVVPNTTFEDGSGVPVDSVLEGSCAKEMGMMKGDLIIAINGNTVTDFEGLRNIVGQSKPGSTCEATIIRNGKTEVLQGIFGSKNMIIKDGYRIYQNDKGLDDQGNFNLDFELDWSNGLMDSIVSKEFNINMENTGPQLVIKNFSADQLKTMGKVNGELEQISYIPNATTQSLELEFSQTKPFTYRITIEDATEGVLYSDERHTTVNTCKKSIAYDGWKQGEYTLKIYCNGDLVVAQRLIIP